LQASSQAIDAGSEAKALEAGILDGVDQRSMNRNYDHIGIQDGMGGSIDIGSFEYRLPNILDVIVDEDASDYVIDLDSYFGFDFSASDYEIVVNTVPGLFSSTVIAGDSGSTNLTLNFALNQAGKSWITVVAKDVDDVVIEERSFLVTVKPANDLMISAPENETAQNGAVIFSSINDNAIQISDADLSGKMTSVLSPAIPDIHYAAQDAERYYSNFDKNNPTVDPDDISEYGIGRHALSIGATRLGLSPSYTLEQFIDVSDANIKDVVSKSGFQY
jgi:hypothetical protein